MDLVILQENIALFSFSFLYYFINFILFKIEHFY